MINKTTLLLKNRNELFKNKKKISSIKQNETYINKINLISKRINYQSKMLKNKEIMLIFKEKIKKINPWYKEICKLKELPINVQQLAINTSCKNTLEYWYIYLNNKKKHLIRYNTWILFKKKLSTITKKKIKLIIEKKNTLQKLTPYEEFNKIYRETILNEYSLLKKDPNIKILKKFFDIEFQKKNINLI